MWAGIYIPVRIGGFNGKKYGYVCVSTREQNEDRQMLAMNEKMCLRKIFF